MDKETLRKLQLMEFDLLKDFIRVCEKHNLRYYMLAGTLLGAVRHDGFIPWDDDIDVGMPREDYEKFIRLSRKKKKKGYSLMMYQKGNSRYPWARLITKEMKLVINMANIPREEYVWIDVIPLDGFPGSKLKSTIHKIHLSFWWNLNNIVQYDQLVDQKRKRSRKGKIAIKIASHFKWIGKFVDYRLCLHKLNKILMKYPFDSNTKYVIDYLAAFGFDEIFDRKYFKSAKKYKFEGEMINGPVDADGVLTTIFGPNYMTPPPEAERNRHYAEIAK